MFCGYCGKQMEDDMLFCPYCGKKIEIVTEDESVNEDNISESNADIKGNAHIEESVSIGEMPGIEENAVGVQVIPEARIMPSVAEDAKRYANRNSDDWYFYNHLQVDATDLPDIEGDYLVSGSKKLLLSDIIKYERRKVENREMISIFDKNGNCIDMELKSSTVATMTVLGAALAGGPAGLAIGTNAAINAQTVEIKNSRIITQLMRIAPLCGDSSLKKQGRQVCELMCAICGKYFYSGIFFPMLDCVKRLEDDEYPIFVGGITNEVTGDLVTYFSVTNKKFAGYEFEDILAVDRKGKNTVVFNFKDGKNKKFALHSKEKADTVEKILNYYRQGRIDEFIENEYKPDLGIVKHKVL